MKKGKLTGKQRLFVLEYIKDFNATRAAVDAGYSKNTGYSIGQRLLKNVEIKTALSKASRKREEKVEVDAEWVLRNLKNLFEISVDDFVVINDLTGQPEYDFAKATKTQRAALETLQIEETRNGLIKTTKIKIGLNNKLKILEAIGKHVNVNAFKEKLEVDITAGKDLMEALIAGRKRAGIE